MQPSNIDSRVARRRQPRVACVSVRDGLPRRVSATSRVRLCEHERSVGKTVGEVPRKVFVIHGRNEPARKGLFAFLRSIGRDRSDGDGWHRADVQRHGGLLPVQLEDA